MQHPESNERARTTQVAHDRGLIRREKATVSALLDPCTNAANFNSLTALMFDVEFGNDEPTMLQKEVLDKEPALKKKPQPSLIR